MATGKIRQRTDVDHDRRRSLMSPKFVDREQRQLRWFHAIQARAALIHAPQPEEIGRIGSQAVKERMDECLLSDRSKQQTLVPLSPKGRGPPAAGAGRAEGAGPMGWVDSKVIRKIAESLMGRSVEVAGQRLGLLRPNQVRAGGTAREDRSSAEQCHRL